MVASALIQTRIDPALRDKASLVLAQMGLTVSDGQHPVRTAGGSTRGSELGRSVTDGVLVGDDLLRVLNAVAGESGDARPRRRHRRATGRLRVPCRSRDPAASPRLHRASGRHGRW